MAVLNICLVMTMITLPAVAALKAVESQRPEVITMCPASEEFIATAEFLKSDNPAMLPATDIVSISSRVSHGCAGAAQRFIDLNNLLAGHDVPTKDLIHYAVGVAQRDQSSFQAFKAVWDLAYSEDGLHLSLPQSLHFAEQVAIEFKGSAQNARQDFFEITNYCRTNLSLQLSSLDCAEIAIEFVHFGLHYKNGIAKDFKQFWQQTGELQGIVFSVGERFDLMREVLRIGPGAGQNFYKAYDYAISAEGMALLPKDALQLAKTMASQTFKKEHWVSPPPVLQDPD